MRNFNYADNLKGLQITTYSSETHSLIHYEDCSHHLKHLINTLDHTNVHILNGIKIEIERL